MNSTTLDPGFALAVRAELVAIGTKKSHLQRHQRRTRLALAGIIAIAIAAATTGTAIVVNSFPGSTTVSPLGKPVAVTRTGTSTIELGRAAIGADSVILDVTCVSGTGNISVPSTDGFSEDASGQTTAAVGATSWNCAQRTTTVHVSDGYLAPGTTSITVTADPGTTWKAVARFGHTTVAPFGVNAHGQTYGTANAKYGEPELQSARATNGKDGFIYTRQWGTVRGPGCINVYESDGTTVIGKFSIGNVDCGSPSDAPTGSGK